MQFEHLQYNGKNRLRRGKPPGHSQKTERKITQLEIESWICECLAAHGLQPQNNLGSLSVAHFLKEGIERYYPV